MKHLSVKQSSALLLVGALCAIAATTGDVTKEDRQLASRQLADSREGLMKAVKGLTPAQWTFKPGADRWSIAEVVEHLALTEELVNGSVLTIEKTQTLLNGSKQTRTLVYTKGAARAAAKTGT